MLKTKVEKVWKVYVLVDVLDWYVDDKSLETLLDRVQGLRPRLNLMVISLPSTL